MTRTLYTILACTLFASGLIGAASASTITWGPATAISGNSDISTAGSYVNAINFGPADVTDTSGDKFYHVQTSLTGGMPGLLASQTGLATAPITVTVDNINYTAGSPGTLDANYNAILSFLGYDNLQNFGVSSTVTLNGLQNNAVYQVEVWASQPVGATAGNSATITSGPNLETSGFFALGTFTADGTGSQTFDFSSAKNPIINAVELRQLTPEPSAFILCGLGAVGLVLAARRRRKA